MGPWPSVHPSITHVNPNCDAYENGSRTSHSQNWVLSTFCCESNNNCTIPTSPFLYKISLLFRHHSLHVFPLCKYHYPFFITHMQTAVQSSQIEYRVNLQLDSFSLMIRMNRDLSTSPHLSYSGTSTHPICNPTCRRIIIYLGYLISYMTITIIYPN